MFTGLVTTWLCLALGSVPADVVPMKDRSFQLPIRSIDPARRAELRELILYYSTDEGRTWKRYTSVPPDSRAFIVNLGDDGIYWFNVCVVDQHGTQEPSDPAKVPPAQKILLDTVKPLLRIVSAVRQGDQVIVTWDLQEEHPDLATMRMEYRTPDMPSGQWDNVPLNPTPSGQASFHPYGTGLVAVRMQVQDVAGNAGSTFVDVAGVGPPATALTTSAAVDSGSAYPQSAPAPLGSSAPTALPSMPLPQSVQQTNLVSPGAALHPDNSGWSSPPSAAPLANSTLSGGALPALQVVNVKQIPIEYQIEKQGPSRVGKVELYVTSDDGKTWRKYAEDTAPRVADEPSSTAQITAELPSEGIYGFAIVAQSRAGLAKHPPLPGDPPEIRVEVDLTPPEVTLYPPEADPDHPNGLLLKWKAFDRNLHSAPVTLQWSEGRDGPWMPIITDQANTGQYSWQLPPNIPVRVYLKLTAKDTAGNVGEVVSREPVLIDVTVPEAHIRGIAVHSLRHP